MLKINRSLDFLACPFCQGNLSFQTNSLSCDSCGQKYELKDSGQIDLKLKSTKLVDQPVLINKPQTVQEFEFSVMTNNLNAEIDYQNIDIPIHLSKEIVSYIPNPQGQNHRVLDLGCGDRVHKDLLEGIGYEWIGLDYYHENAPILGDAQALPFQDNSFDLIIAVAMISELPYPHIAMQEVFRVLKPGGTFIGTAPFLEPYFDTTYSHFSHAGIYSLLDSCGFELDLICPSGTWTVLDSLPEMVLFPRLPTTLTKAIVFPLKLSHIVWWKLANIVTGRETSDELSRIKRTSGSTDFVVKKPKV